MSTPATGGAAPVGAEQDDGKGKSGLGKVISRMRTVMKRSGTSSKRQSTVPPAAAAVVVPAAATKTTDAGTQTQIMALKAKYGDSATIVTRREIHEERAKKLARYGFEMQPSQWHATEGEVLRVDRAPRVRIRRQCHNCKTTFGSGDVCPSCKHKRCNKCTERTPAKRTGADKVANQQRRDALVNQREPWMPIQPRYAYDEEGELLPGMSDDMPLAKPTRTGGQPLVRKKTRMRVRRSCHQCKEVIKSKTRTCDNCGHQRCGDCERSPAMRDKYPYGYPNDQPGANQPAFHRCQVCRTKFPRDAADGTECANADCSHAKCGDCPRVAPRKVDRSHVGPPDVMAALGERMREVRL